MPYRVESETIGAEDALQEAAAAARQREPIGALDYLGRSGFLDGLVRRIGGAYPDLGRATAEDLVADGVGRLYLRIVDEEKACLESPESYLFKLVFKLAKKETDRRRDEEEAARQHERIDFEHEQDAPSRDVLREQAIRVARSLISRIGHQNAQRVMTVVLDAVEAQEPVSPSEIGAALGLVPNTVSKLIERGIARLGRVAEEEGLQMSIDYAMAIEEEFEDE